MDKNNVLVGVGTLEVTRDGGTTWTETGYTEGGVSFSQSIETFEVEVDQEVDPVDEVVTKRVTTISTQLAESSLENIAMAWNYDPDADITEGTGTKTLDLKSTADLKKFGVRFTGKGPNGKHRRWSINRVAQIGESSIGHQKGEKTVIPLEMKVYSDGSGSLGTVVDSDTEFVA